MNTNINQLNEFLNYTKGQFLGFEVKNKRMSKAYIFSGKVKKVTKNYVDVKPYSGLFRGETRFHKSAIRRLVGFNGLEYRRES